jgi:hypothetical protein
VSFKILSSTSAMTVSMLRTSAIRKTVDNKHKTVKEIKAVLFISIILCIIIGVLDF